MAAPLRSPGRWRGGSETGFTNHGRKSLYLAGVEVDAGIAPHRLSLSSALEPSKIRIVLLGDGSKRGWNLLWERNAGAGSSR